MRSASLRALPFLRGRRLWTRWGLLHRTQLGGLPHSGLGDEARDVLRGRHVEGRVPGRTPLRGDRLPVEVEDLLRGARSEEHTSELQSPDHLVCRLLLEKKNNLYMLHYTSVLLDVGHGRH